MTTEDQAWEPENEDAPHWKPTVVDALNRVMDEVQSISKDSRNTQQNFNFRGIDAVINAVGPALRKHGVVVVPTAAVWEHERYKTRNDAQMRGVTITVTFRFYGPRGDWIEAQACGEAADAGDKAIPKAHSVAYRTLLLQALCIPTDEPDPDSAAHERAVIQERREDAKTATPARSWAELIERLGLLIDADEVAAWLAQAKDAAEGLPEPSLFARCNGAMLDLYDLEGDLAFDPEIREKVRAIFAKRLDGAELEGPAWALNAAEAEDGRPAKPVAVES